MPSRMSVFVEPRVPTLPDTRNSYQTRLMVAPASAASEAGATMSRVWYELRVSGSVGTRGSTKTDMREGIALSETGRLCAVSSGHARRFDSREEAVEFLGRTTIPGIYEFE